MIIRRTYGPAECWRSLRRLAQGDGLRPRVAIIAGTGKTARAVARRFKEKPAYGLAVRGFLTESEGEVGRVYDGIAVIGTIHQASSATESDVDVVLLCLPAHLEPHAEKLLHELRNSTVDVLFVPSLAADETLAMEVTMVEGFPMLALQRSPVQGWRRTAKRAVDLLGAGAVLLTALPLLALIALSIKLSSPGPVLYRQLRLGLGGRPFVMFKFRTMHVEAERDSGPVWAVPKDPRVTSVGRVLRKTSLDELPQLWNVLKGEMSLVGPRPERPTFIDVFRRAHPSYMLRHKVQAGMTGWAQVNGWRGNTCIRMRIAHDLYYIQHWSLWFDIKILCRTLWRGLYHENAH